jgi:hypothetical protein
MDRLLTIKQSLLGIAGDPLALCRLISDRHRAIRIL